MKTVIDSAFLDSTCHPLPKIARNKNVFLKTLWVLCLLTSCAFCILDMVKSLEDYLSYSSYISTEVVQEIPTEFPAVTICNLKSVNRVLYAEFFHAYFDELKPDQFTSPFEFMILELYQTKLALSQFLSKDERRAMGYQLQDMLVTCVFNFMPCNFTDFVHSYHPLYGNCYTFNQGVGDNGTISRVQKVMEAGMLYGLTLELFLGDPVKQSSHELTDGLIISIHNQSSMPFSEETRIIAATGAETSIIINRNFVSKLDLTYNACLSDTSKSSKFSSKYFDHVVRHLNAIYSQKYCFSLCFQNMLNEKCNCSNVFMPRLDLFVSYCVRGTHFECFDKQMRESSNNSAMINHCKQACPYPCNFIEYETSSFWSYYPTHFHKKILYNNSAVRKSNVSFNDLTSAVAMVNIYYKSMSYTSIQEKISISLEAFFSNIGGTIGLYLGISILSIIELAELLFNLAEYWRNSKKVNTSQVGSRI